jgi:hypothetical protein
MAYSLENQTAEAPPHIAGVLIQMIAGAKDEMDHYYFKPVAERKRGHSIN